MSTYTNNNERPELSAAASTTALYHGEPGDKHAIHPVPATVVDTTHSHVGHRCPITEQPPRPPLESRDTKNILCDLNEPVDETATAYTTVEGARQNAVPTPRVEKTGMDWGNTSTVVQAGAGAGHRTEAELVKGVQRINVSSGAATGIGAGTTPWRSTGDVDMSKNAMGGKGAAHVDGPTPKTSSTTTENLIAKTEQSPATAPTAGWAAPPATGAGSGSGSGSTTTTASSATAEAQKETLRVQEEGHRRKSSTSSGKSGSSSIFGKIKDAIIG
ncbi:hypothetical protein YB2330_000209 [Saitoella coloradoensis]